MKNTPIPDNDAERVSALREYQVLDSEPEIAYDEITEILAQICDCPVATIGLMDEAQEFYKSKVGFAQDVCWAPREMNICSHTVCGTDIMHIPDLAADDRFADYPGVCGNPHYRFYCGMPLVNRDGYVLGNICVVDFEPRELSFEQTETMRRLARQVMSQLELRRSLAERDQALEELEAARSEMEEQKAKSDKLLLNILPAAIAEELKESNRVAAKYCDLATILFTDFEDFTRLAEQTVPKALVDELDQHFSALDEIAENHHLEMLKTIGDSYMCVGGLPDPNRTHVVDACLAALEMQDYMEKVNQQREKMRLPLWKLRIGMHTGPVMAGVVGRRKFSYDVWGDAVNVAARMTSAGDPGRINISDSIYHRVKALFDLEERGSIEVKNKGPLAMYFLEGFKPELSDDNGLTPNLAFHEECGKAFRGYVPVGAS
jgi:class 3 adenylate cyclase